MKIVRVHLAALRNEEWFQFMTEVRDLIVKFTAQALSITELFVLFLKFYLEADTALEIIRKSPETEKMIEADHLRDQTFHGLNTTIRAAVFHFNPAHSEAARQLTIVLDRFGNLAQKAPNEETAGIYNLVQELRGVYAGYIETLGLTEWVEELAARNEAYEALVKARNEEVAARPKLHVKQTRHELDGVYHRIVERIEALCLVRGPENFAAFIEQLNAFATRYNNVVAQRRGQHKPAPLYSTEENDKQ
jgi:trans-aconitate methyltransferase